MSYIEDHEVTYAKKVPVLHTKKKQTPRFLVMHYTAGFSVESAIQSYRNRRVSAHLTVDTDGTVYQHVPFDTVAWHAGPSRWMGYTGLNNCSIGIEIINAGWFKKSGNSYCRDKVCYPASKMPQMEAHPHPRVGSGTYWWPVFPEPQISAVEDLAEMILDAYPILDIVSHEQIDTRGWKTDPGPAFPMDRFQRLLHRHNIDRDADGFLHRVTAGTLNVRGGPGTEFQKISTVHRGDLVTVVDTHDQWRRIDIGDGGEPDGWVHSAYLQPA